MNQQAEVKSGAMLSPKEMAVRLAVSVRTLRRWRRRGIGPAWRKIGETVRYEMGGVEKGNSLEDSAPQADKGGQMRP